MEMRLMKIQTQATHNCKFYTRRLRRRFLFYKFLKSVIMNKHRFKFAFLVHPRSFNDVFKKFPVFKYLPKWMLVLIERYFPPVIVSRVTGLSDIHGNDVVGYIISIPMTARRMLKERGRAVRQIRIATLFARFLGANIVGLGALTSSLTHGGKKLLDIDNITITTGHAYTGFNVTKNIFQIREQYDISLHESIVGIVGAAGSIGGISAKILARAGVKKLILIDLERKLGKVKSLVRSINSSKSIKILTSADLMMLRDCHFIITATNAPGALVKSEHVSSGTIIVDDAQPSDIDIPVFERDDVAVLEAGAVHTPGIRSNFDIGLQNKEENYCCMAEVLILAFQNYEGDSMVGQVTLKQVDNIGRLGNMLGFKPAKYQNMYGYIDNKLMYDVVSLLKKRMCVL